MGLGILFVDKVAVVGTDVFHTALLGQFQQFGIHLDLFGVGFAVSPDVAVRNLMALEFQVIVLAEHLLEPHHGFFGLLHAALHDLLRNFTAQTGRADNESFVEQLQVFVVGAWTHVEAVDPRAGDELDEVVVALFVLGQHDQVPARLVDAFELEAFVAASGHIHFAAENRLEVGYRSLLGQCRLTFGNELLGVLALIRVLAILVGLGSIGAVMECFELLFSLFHRSLGLAAHFVGVVEELLDTHHVAMVGHGHAAHAVGNGLVNQFGDGRLSVKNGILGVYVQVNEVLHSCGVQRGMDRVEESADRQVETNVCRAGRETGGCGTLHGGRGMTDKL